MTVALQEALALWDMGAARAELAARRENQVWRVAHEGACFALRFHRPGYRSVAQLNSELEWMTALADQGLSVPRALPLVKGGWVGRAGAHDVSLLQWLPGKPLGAAGALHAAKSAETIAGAMGAMIAHMHDLSDRWSPSPGFTRPDWRRCGLLGDDPLWGRFWEHPHLSTDQRDLFLAARARADTVLARIEADQDQGLIHADLLAENVLIHRGALSFIDFDDCAWGFRDFELATFLIKFIEQPYYAQMRAALVKGYAARRPVDPHMLDFMLLLRALTYPGWIIARLAEPGSAERSARAVRVATALAQTFIGDTS